MERYIGKEELNLLKKVINSQKLWKKEGTFVRQFEKAFSKHLGTKYVIAVNSGTSALESCVAACNISVGDEVICTAYSFIASSSAVLRFYGIPIFADVDPRTLCLDPEDIKQKITKRTKAILVVHIYGQPAKMDEIMKIAKRHNLYVIEDCCQAYDSCYKGKKVGTIGDIAAFSLQQAKQITCGEGGIIATNNEVLFRKASMYSNVGMIWDWKQPEEGSHFAMGGNYRMSELQAAVALAQLKKIKKFNAKRKQFVRIIEKELSNIKGIELAYSYKGAKPNYYFYPLRYDESKVGMSHDEFIKRCEDEVRGKDLEIHAGTAPISYFEPLYRDIHKKIHYPIGYRNKIEYKRGLCPRLEEIIPNKFITIRMHQGRTVDEIKEVVNVIKKVLQKNKKGMDRLKAAHLKWILPHHLIFPPADIFLLMDRCKECTITFLPGFYFCKMDRQRYW